MKSHSSQTTLFLIAIFLLSSCASIVSKSSYPVSVKSNPEGADIKIINNKGMTIFTGTTPTVIPLKAGGGFFEKASYTIEFQKVGYTNKTIYLDTTIDGWYFGNLVFGGIIGFLIIDPATGAMWKMDREFVHETLSPSVSGIQPANQHLEIYQIAEIPEEWKDNLKIVK